MRPITHIVIHCSATPNGDDRFRVDDLDRMHRERGWRELGYHFVIHVDGALHEGRKLEAIGAHVAGSNATSIGICMIGTDRFRLEQWETLQALVRELQNRFQAARVVGHRDFSPDLDGDGVLEPWEWFKLCPGFDVADWRLGGMHPLWNPNHLYGMASVAA